MQQLVYFFQKYKYFLFFLLLQSIALFFTINNNSFHKSKFISSANSITGGFYEKASQISDYFLLKAQNKELIAENEQLKNLLEKYRNIADSSTTNFTVIDTVRYHQKYVYTAANIIKNDYHKTTNYLTIDKGISSGVQKEMAVINSKGIIGITDASSTSYTRVQSILNSNSKINAKLQKNNHFGTLTWNGKTHNIVQLEDVPRQANAKVGDTIITGGKSSIFPEGILIGTIKTITPNNTNTINVELFNDMRAIKTIYVIKHLDKKEIESLNNPTYE
ncbi:MAG: rod shape-determining protein MreC [Flavobacteriaceae bacterium]|nr:rod shape-determining protein MreC [Flavobacteriaceae bacterium]